MTLLIPVLAHFPKPRPLPGAKPLPLPVEPEPGCWSQLVRVLVSADQPLVSMPPDKPIPVRPTSGKWEKKNQDHHW